MGGIIHTHHADAELVGELHATLHGLVGDGLTEFFMSIPDLRCGKTGRQDFNFSPWRPLPNLAAEEVVKVDCLQGIVRANPMARGAVAESCGVGGFRFGVSTLEISLADEVIVEIRIHHEVFIAGVHDF